MSLLPPTKALLQFLSKSPHIRAQIAASPGATVLYAGRLIRPAWMEIDEWKKSMPQMATKKTLPDVLADVKLHGQQYPDLLAWTKSLDSLVPWKENGFIAWRSLSGIFASNARGAVSFVIGDGVTKQDKVFAATEINVLSRNPHVDELTRDLLEYYDRCLKAGKSDLCVSYVAG